MPESTFCYLISNYRTAYQNDEHLDSLLCTELNINPTDLIKCKVLKKSLDARQNKKNIFYQYNIFIETRTSIAKKQGIQIQATQELTEHSLIPTLATKPVKQPVIIGYGPAGMFAAYTLLQSGIKALVIERGEKVDERQKRINRLWRYQEFNSESNVQFGEGGAGFFSDGKLGTRIKSPFIKEVYKIFIKFGAKESILSDNKPHLGTDKLKGILKKFRNYLEENGVEFQFNTKLENIITKNNQVQSIVSNHGTIETNTVFLCTGHSCRDVYRMLHKNGVQMEHKEFAVGFRVEHPQEFINKCQYGQFFHDLDLPPADYKLHHFDENSQKGVYSFCMCPGGIVVLATSSAKHIVTNGMSLSNRGGKFANAALVVTVKPEEFGEHLFAGIDFQESIEQKAFELSGSYMAPAQRIKDYLKNKKSETLPKSSFLPGLFSTNLQSLYPPFITKRIIEAINAFDKKMPSFIQEDAILIAPETRTSSPLRITRNPETYESSNTKGLIPLGEGAGAAGGITSAAVEGINGAIKWINQNQT